MPEIPPCDLCSQSQFELGALLFSPPDEEGKCDKLHVCTSCFEQISRNFGPSQEDSSITEPQGCDESYYVLARRHPMGGEWFPTQGPYQTLEEAIAQDGMGGLHILLVQHRGEETNYTPVAKWINEERVWNTTDEIKRS